MAMLVINRGYFKRIRIPMASSTGQAQNISQACDKCDKATRTPNRKQQRSWMNASPDLESYFPNDPFLKQWWGTSYGLSPAGNRLIFFQLACLSHTNPLFPSSFDTSWWFQSLWKWWSSSDWIIIPAIGEVIMAPCSKPPTKWIILIIIDYH